MKQIDTPWPLTQPAQSPCSRVQASEATSQINHEHSQEALMEAQALKQWVCSYSERTGNATKQSILALV